MNTEEGRCHHPEDYQHADDSYDRSAQDGPGRVQPEPGFAAVEAALAADAAGVDFRSESGEEGGQHDDRSDGGHGYDADPGDGHGAEEVDGEHEKRGEGGGDGDSGEYDGPPGGPQRGPDGAGGVLLAGSSRWPGRDRGR